MSQPKKKTILRIKRKIGDIDIPVEYLVINQRRKRARLSTKSLTNDISSLSIPINQDTNNIKPKKSINYAKYINQNISNKKIEQKPAIFRLINKNERKFQEISFNNNNIHINMLKNRKKNRELLIKEKHNKINQNKIKISKNNNNNNIINHEIINDNILFNDKIGINPNIKQKIDKNEIRKNINEKLKKIKKKNCIVIKKIDNNKKIEMKTDQIDDDIDLIHNKKKIFPESWNDSGNKNENNGLFKVNSDNGELYNLRYNKNFFENCEWKPKIRQKRDKKMRNNNGNDGNINKGIDIMGIDNDKDDGNGIKFIDYEMKINEKTNKLEYCKIKKKNKVYLNGDNNDKGFEYIYYEIIDDVNEYEFDVKLIQNSLDNINQNKNIQNDTSSDESGYDSEYNTSDDNYDGDIHELLDKNLIKKKPKNIKNKFNKSNELDNNEYRINNASHLSKNKFKLKNKLLEKKSQYNKDNNGQNKSNENENEIENEFDFYDGNICDEESPEPNMDYPEFSDNDNYTDNYYYNDCADNYDNDCGYLESLYE